MLSGTVLVTAGVFLQLGNEGKECLEGAGLTVKVPVHSGAWTEEDVIEAVTGCVAVLAGMEPYTERVFASLPDLKVIARWGIGYDSIDVAAATRHGVMVINTPGMVTEAVADMTLALMLGVARRIPFCDQSVRQGQWPLVFSGQLFSKTLGLVGLGQIGQAVARRAKGFSMNVLVYDPYCDDGVCERMQVARAPLEVLLAESDFVSLHCTMCPETRHLINAERLRMMKPTAYLINAGRGGLVDPVALAEALREKVIAGAGLDVFAQEPPEADDPLLSLDNVVLTPHCSSFTYDTVAKVNERACRNVIEALSGEVPAALLNPEVLER
ncbi:MAG: phosphoglycerate dehydrogenase [Armatimonadia bacterium]